MADQWQTYASLCLLKTRHIISMWSRLRGFYSMHNHFISHNELLFLIWRILDMCPQWRSVYITKERQNCIIRQIKGEKESRTINLKYELNLHKYHKLHLHNFKQCFRVAVFVYGLVLVDHHIAAETNRPSFRCSFYQHGLTLIPTSNHKPIKVWNEITNRFSNFNGCLEVWEWICFFIPQFMMGVINHPCWD